MKYYNDNHYHYFLVVKRSDFIPLI